MRLATVARTEDRMLHAGWAVVARLPWHGWGTPPPQSWRMVSTPEAGGRSGTPAHAKEGPARLALLPSKDDEDP
jgi:hypothetical protein